MRSDADFIKDLRSEIAESQKRRTGYVKAKLVFITGLLGLGSLSLKEGSRTAALLYLVPIVSFVFDLYILGEDFGIKRAGRFIACSPAAPPEEKLWEKVLDKTRDLMSFFAGPISTLAAAAAAGVAICVFDIVSRFFLPWSILSILIVLFPIFNKMLRARTLRRFEGNLDKERNTQGVGDTQGVGHRGLHYDCRTPYALTPYDLKTQLRIYS